MFNAIKNEYNRFIKKQYKKIFGNYELAFGENTWSDLWKEYYHEYKNEIYEKMSKLKTGLDEESQRIADLVFERYVFLYPWQKYKYSYTCRIDDFFTANEIDLQKKKYNFDKSKYKLPVGIYYEPSIFNYGHGLSCLDKETLTKLKKGDLIDGGAFVGDSAIYMKDFIEGNVYSFEPIAHNFKLLKETISINKCENKIIPIKFGLGEKEEEIEIYKTAFCASIHGDKSAAVKINITTIDNFVKKNKINPSLIKLDVEGNELEAIKGAEATIKKFKPTLLISVYHHPKDFFDIKPYLESLNLGYKFSLRKLNPDSPVYETMLICHV